MLRAKLRPVFSRPLLWRRSLHSSSSLDAENQRIWTKSGLTRSERSEGNDKFPQNEKKSNFARNERNLNSGGARSDTRRNSIGMGISGNSEQNFGKSGKSGKFEKNQKTSFQTKPPSSSLPRVRIQSEEVKLNRVREDDASLQAHGLLTHYLRSQYSTSGRGMRFETPVDATEALENEITRRIRTGDAYMGPNGAVIQSDETTRESYLHEYYERLRDLRLDQDGQERLFCPLLKVKEVDLEETLQMSSESADETTFTRETTLTYGSVGSRDRPVVSRVRPLVSHDHVFTTSGVYPVVSRGFHSMSRDTGVRSRALLKSRDTFVSSPGHSFHTSSPLNQDYFINEEYLKTKPKPKPESKPKPKPEPKSKPKPKPKPQTSKVKGKKPRTKKEKKSVRPVQPAKRPKGVGLKTVKLAHEPEKKIEKKIEEKRRNQIAIETKMVGETKWIAVCTNPPPDDNGEMFKKRFDQKLDQVYFPVGPEWENHPKALAPITLPDELHSTYRSIEKNADTYVELLRLLVERPAIARQGLEGHTAPYSGVRKHIFHNLARLGYKVKTLKVVPPNPKYLELALPFMLVQSKTPDYQKPTVLVYMSYDTVHAHQEGFTQYPYALGRKDGLLTGRGTTAKAPASVWMSALHALKQCGIEPTVNLKFCFDPFGQIGNPVLEEVLNGEEAQFFDNIHACVVSEGQWMTNSQPNIIYGQRGVHNFRVKLENGERRVDAGRYAGSVPEPLTELTQLLSKLTNVEGQLLPETETKIDFGVADVNEEETRQIGELALTEEKLKELLLVSNLRHDTFTKNMQHIWREPALTIHTITNSVDLEKTYPITIPESAQAEFSIRTVPNMDATSVNYIVEEYLRQHHAKTKSKLKLTVDCKSSTPWWLASRDHWNYRSVARAIKSVWKVDPEYTREGGTSGVAALLEQRTRANVVVMPLGKPSDAVRTAQENVDEVNFINGIKTVATYLFHAGKIQKGSDDFITVTPKEKKEKEHVSKLGDLIPVKKKEVEVEEKPKRAVKNPQVLSSLFVDRKVEKRKQLYGMKRVVIVGGKGEEKKEVDEFRDADLDELIEKKEEEKKEQKKEEKKEDKRPKNKERR